MSDCQQHDRQFGRRHVTWKLTDVTRESLKTRLYSPGFSILLGDNKTEWCLLIEERSEFLGVYLRKSFADRTDFSVGFSVAIKTKGEAWTLKHSAFFLKSCDEMFKDGLGHGFPKIVSLHVLFDEKEQLLNGKELTVDLELELMENSKHKMPSTVGEEFFDVNEKLINNEQYSDFVFICSDGGKVFVQKSVIAVHCEAFATMLNAGLSETKTNSASVTDIDYETMLELIRYLYCRRVNNMKEIHEKLVIAANKYGIEKLKLMCVSSLMESLTLENVVRIFHIADLVDEEHLKKNCISFIKCKHLRLQNRIEKEECSTELLWALWKSTDLNPIQIWFQNQEVVPAFD